MSSFKIFTKLTKLCFKSSKSRLISSFSLVRWSENWSVTLVRRKTCSSSPSNQLQSPVLNCSSVLSFTKKDIYLPALTCPLPEISKLTKLRVEPVSSWKCAIRYFMNIECHACISSSSVRDDMKPLQEGPQIVVGTPSRVQDMVVLSKSIALSPTQQKVLFD